jgi:hypothetical protein
LVTKLGEVLTDQVFKYDLYAQEILLKRNGKEHRLPTDYVVSFDLVDKRNMKKKTFALAKPSDDMGKTYYEILYIGKWALVRGNKMEVKEHAEIAATYGDQSKLRFINKAKVYIKKGKDAKPVLFGPSWSSILNIFPEKREDVKAFIRYNYLNINKEEDLVKLIQHIEVLYGQS